MNQEEKEEMSRVIAGSIASSATVVLIEHDVGIVLNRQPCGGVDYGRKLADGAPDEVRNNPDGIAAHFGTVHWELMSYFLKLVSGLFAGVMYHSSRSASCSSTRHGLQFRTRCDACFRR